MPDSFLPDHIGNISVSTDKDGTKWRSIIIDEIKQVQSNAPNIALYLRKLKLIGRDDCIELRFCYYYATDKGGWGFAKNPPMMPASDFFAIVDEAKKKEWRN